MAVPNSRWNTTERLRHPPLLPVCHEDQMASELSELSVNRSMNYSNLQGTIHPGPTPNTETRTDPSLGISAGVQGTTVFRW